LPRNTVLLELLRQYFFDEAIAVENGRVDLLLTENLGGIVGELPFENRIKSLAGMFTAGKVDGQFLIPRDVANLLVFLDTMQAGTMLSAAAGHRWFRKRCACLQ
jgi:hypothetical protein